MYTQKTFDQLKSSVLRTMDKLELQPVAVTVGSNREITEVAEEYVDSFLNTSLSSSTPENMKRLRALLGHDHEPCYNLKLVRSGIKAEEMKFTYTVDFDRKDGVYLQKRGKHAVSFGKILGDFDDNLKLALKMSSGGYSRRVSEDFQLAEHGVPQAELIKHFVNKFKAKSKPIYIYFADSSIARHFKTFHQLHDLQTCLSRSNNHYSRKVNGKYYHPLNILDKSPNIRLALISETHHDEWQEGVYPFVGRCLVVMSQCGTVTGVSRYYGNEKYNRNTLTKVFNVDDGMRGGLFNAVYDDNQELILIHADQLTCDQEDRNSVGWLEDVSDSFYRNNAGAGLELFRTRKDLLIMGNFNGCFGVTPSYDGKEVTTCRGPSYVRNDRPKALEHHNFVHVSGFGVLDKTQHNLKFNSRTNDYITESDVDCFDVADGQPISARYVQNGTYVESVFGDFIHHEDALKIAVGGAGTWNPVTRYLPKDNTMGITEGQTIQSDDLDALIATTIAA